MELSLLAFVISSEMNILWVFQLLLPIQRVRLDPIAVEGTHKDCTNYFAYDIDRRTGPTILTDR